MPSAVLSVLYGFLTAYSGYNLYLASISISNLQQYEDRAKEAAKYSNIAEDQLHKTRTTQASGTLAVLLTFLNSAAFVFASPTILPRLFAIGGNVVALLAAREHVGEFWRAKAKVPLPGVGDYNEAVSKTQEIRLGMAYMAVCWVVIGGISFIF